MADRLPLWCYDVTDQADLEALIDRGLTKDELREVFAELTAEIELAQVEAFKRGYDRGKESQTDAPTGATEKRKGNK